VRRLQFCHPPLNDPKDYTKVKERNDKAGGSVEGLVQSLGLAHGRLDVERPDVLPLLLEQRDQEVDGQHGVGHDLVLLHVDVTDGDGETEHLLQLEFDGRSDLVDLLGQVLAVGYRGGELAGFGKTGTQETRDLLDQSLRSEESVVLLSELLDELLVLVQLLQVLNGHEGKLLIELLSPVDVGGVGENAELHSGSGNMGEFDGSGETLVPLRVVVLEANLELDRLDKVLFFPPASL